MAYFCFLEKEVIKCSALICLIPWHKPVNLLTIVAQSFSVFFLVLVSFPYASKGQSRATNYPEFPIRNNNWALVQECNGNDHHSTMMQRLFILIALWSNIRI